MRHFMRIFIIIILTVLCYSVLLTLSLFILEKDNEIDIYKLADARRESDYIALQKSYNLYVEKTKNTKQLIIVANTNESKNIAIGNTLYKYANLVQGDISIYYKNLTTGESVIIDGDKEYYMASLYKVILTIFILDQIKNGHLKLTDAVGIPPITVQQALTKIISESNNEYAQSLASQYGWVNIESAMKQELGIDFSFNSDLQTNVKNMGALFEEIALSLRLSDIESAYLLQLLHEQQKTTKLPKYLPPYIYSHNKTGEFNDYSHDAGIFYTAKANYILIFMSKTVNVSGTNEKMAKMAKDVFDSLNEINDSQQTDQQMSATTSAYIASPSSTLTINALK